MAGKNEAASQLVHEKAFLNQTQADSYYTRLDSDLPWGKYSWVPGTPPLKQLVYYYDLQEQKLRPNPLLEELIQIVEARYKTKSIVTWCNKFRDSKDKIDWHQDQYGMSLFVLSFGANRPVELRPRKNLWTHRYDRPATKTLDVTHGDLYYWTARFDETMEHRVTSATVNGPRISVLILGHPVGSNDDPMRLQQKAMNPVYTGQCNTCEGFLEEGTKKLWGPERKCKSCGKKFYYTNWE